MSVTGSVYVPVFYFFSRGIAHPNHLEVQTHILIFHFFDAGKRRLPGLVLHLKLGPDFHGDFSRELVARHVHESLFISVTIAFCCGYHYLLAIANRHTGHLAFQSRDDIPCAMYEFQRLSTF
jgi:hypothetical protein